MSHLKCTFNYLPRRCQGFSIVEMMVAMVIALILLGGIAQIFLSSRQSFTIQNTLGRQQENGRYGTNIISQDLRRTGYWGGNADVSGVTGTEPPIAPAATCNTGDNSWGRMIDRRVFGLNHTETAPLGAYACINDGNGHSSHDVLVMRFASPWLVFPTPTTNQRPIENDSTLYIRSSLTISDLAGRIFKGSAEVGSGGPDPANDMNGGAAAPPSERTSELIARAYYIGPSGQQTCNGIAVPSLYREKLDNNGQPVAEEIAYGVDNLQIRYGLDTTGNCSTDASGVTTCTGDGSVDVYLDAGSDGLDEDSEWDQVVAVRYWLLTRAECPETGYTNGNTYTMGDLVYTPADGFRRQLYQSTVKLRNI
jgi:type IV pilus assembly protein PilW